MTDVHDRPALSVILVGAGDARSIQKTIRHLAAQTIRDQVEVVVAVPDAEALDLDALPTDGLQDVRAVSAGPLVSTARSRVPAIHAARADVVAFVEDHSFPPPEWAARLVEAHRGDYVAVAPVVTSANAGSATGRANHYIEYGAWEFGDGTEPEHLPGHNGSYKRDVLLTYGDRLGEMLEAESVIHWDLGARGERLRLLRDLEIPHINFSQVPATIRLRFHGGRAFAASRSRGWSAARRALYALAAPAIPALRLGRIVRAGWATPHRADVVRTLPALAGYLLLDGLGEMVGYASGAGSATARLGAIEIQRDRFVRADEVGLLFDA